jgi:23S rRNA U2552 (ribose-2'-O)-methylase RlmE/FtsJ
MARRKLVKALQRAFNMIADDAKQLAETVEHVFQGEDEVNDEDLNKDVRSLFYSLEREKLMNIRRTEYKF